MRGDPKGKSRRTGKRHFARNCDHDYARHSLKNYRDEGDGAGIDRVQHRPRLESFPRKIMAEAGIEPTSDSDASYKTAGSCVTCLGTFAANALHAGGSSCLWMERVDAELQRVIEAWPSISMPIKAAILALINSQE